MGRTGTKCTRPGAELAVGREADFTNLGQEGAGGWRGGMAGYSILRRASPNGHGYSYLSASIGSRREAFRAG